MGSELRQRAADPALAPLVSSPVAPGRTGVHNARLMSTPKPGQIQCPTCHRATPPTAFCTQCGAPIPPATRARPRGLGREELDERRRARRPGDMPFRRGVPVGEPGEQPFRAEPFRPEPEDELVRQPGPAGGEGEPRVDNTPPGFDSRPVEPPPEPVPTFAAPSPAPPAPAPSSAAEPPRPAPTPVPVPPVAALRDEEEPVWPGANQDYPAAEPYAEQYGAPAYDDERERRSGLVGPLAVVAFVALGVMAIGIGAVISGILGAGAQATPSPTPLVSQAPASTGPSGAPSPTSSVVPTPSVAPTPEQPVVFPDGFTAHVEPCAEQPTSIDGCDSDGSTITGDTVWVWIGFHQGGDGDMLSVTILDSNASAVRDGSIDLGDICSSCNGYARFRFSGLSPGSYTIKVERNGEFADEATFAVAG